ncbi:MAG: hypothetical protein K2O10_03135 [Muribaculaceae bacterium]|nr:hypothetical protein [Muribaculaceae bacterium]
MLALGALNSGAIDADNLYLMGPGTRSGWYAGEDNRDKIISLDNHGDGEKRAVAFLKNVDGRSFRFQPSVDWGDTYYGPASPNETVALGQDVAVHQTGDNTWTVPFAGIFEMYVRMATNNLFMFQASKIYVVGNVNGQSWVNDGSTYLSLKDGADGEYTGDMTLDQGEFKFTIDPSKEWDSRYWLFRQDAGHFTTDSDGDRKWTVGDGCDLSAGRYRVNLDTKDQSVSFTRLPSEVLLDGVAFERDGDHMVATSPVFIKAGQDFYVTIDGVVRSTSVPVSGYYMLKVSPFVAGEWPVVYPVNEEPLDVYADGLCGLDLNAAGTGYVNDHLNWRDAGQGYDFYAGGYKIGHADVTVAGWQRATVDFDGNRAVCRLESMEPRITGQGVDRGLGLPVSPNGKFTEPGVSLAKGTYTVSVGDMSQTLEIPQAGMYVVKFWVETSASGEASLKTVATGPIEVRMPLKPEDFAGGRKHYFLVGQRTSAWRLQPEWEFVPAADGTLTIPARLLYNGYVMVGMVDNYDDYVAQRYRGFTSPNTNVETQLRPGHTDGDFAFPLAELASYNTDGKYRAMRYDNVEGTSPGVQNGGYDKLPLRMIGILSSEGTIGEDTQQDRSSRVNTITLSVDGAGNPSTVRFNGVNGAPSEVIKIKTFSMVGSSIYNVDVPYNSNAVTSPLNRQEGYGGDDGSAKQWAEAWIQFDSKGDPYVDAYGEYIYHTSFTANWLRSHPTYFKDETGFEFTSNNITFFYTPDVERPDQFGQRTFELAGEQDHKEVLYTYYDMPSDDN